MRVVAGEALGVEYVHTSPEGQRHVSWVPFGEPDGWKVEGLEPLTISPSLLCRECGHHGFIRGGQWVPA